MIHDRPPCFVCETREAARGQVLCSICIAWAEARGRRRMGADGHIRIVKRASWDFATGNADPRALGFYVGTVLGVPAVWGYIGDNLFEPNYGGWCTEKVTEDNWETMRDATPEEREKNEKAVAWFDANCESHEVWT